MSAIMYFMNLIGKMEYVYKYPVLYEEYMRRMEFEKFALLYYVAAKKEEGVVEDLNFLDDSDTILEYILMYLCCVVNREEKDATLMKRMKKPEILSKLMRILNKPYKRFSKHGLLWDFLPCHTTYGLIFLVSMFGWLGWCLNYLLLFAAYHSSSVSENILISYATSQLTTVFISQPLTILLTIAISVYLYKNSDSLPWPLSLIKYKNDRIPSVFYYSNPWNRETHTSLTSEFAYIIFVKCPAQASQINVSSYAPFKSILRKLVKDDDTASQIDTSVKDLYMKLSRAKFDRDLSRGFE